LARILLSDQSECAGKFTDEISLDRNSSQLGDVLSPITNIPKRSQHPDQMLAKVPEVRDGQVVHTDYVGEYQDLMFEREIGDAWKF
jgi:hypothetical protein